MVALATARTTLSSDWNKLIALLYAALIFCYFLKTLVCDSRQVTLRYKCG
jgi:hypothetical protein